MTRDPFPRAFDTIDPDGPRFAAMEARVLDAYDISQRSLALEWVEMSREHPLVTGLCLAAAAAVLLFATPVGAVWWVLQHWA